VSTPAHTLEICRLATSNYWPHKLLYK